ncbi:MAG: hypothetical protein EBU13_01135 [Synechococcaceae bacterium WB5_2A_257]|nr:hypothetical protein [Synechococcaceae bacterium WB5_2A_257]
MQQQQPEGQRAPQPSFNSIDPVEIAATLAEKGIGFERWPAPVNLSSNAEAEEILRAYGPEIARVQANGNYQTIDAFNNPDGWVAEFSGDQIAKYYPLLESDN